VQSMRPGWLAWAAFVFGLIQALPMRRARLYQPFALRHPTFAPVERSIYHGFVFYSPRIFLTKGRGVLATRQLTSSAVQHRPDCWMHFTSRENLVMSTFPKYLFTVRG
jgi:hypothetical protein